MLQKRIVRDFCNFSPIFGGAWASQNRAKIDKIRKPTQKNRSQKNMCFSTPLFLDFSWFRLPKTMPTSSPFRIFFENVDFIKIMLPPRRNQHFSGFGPPKNDAKSTPKRTRKKHRKKTSRKSILASIVSSQILQKSSKIAKNRSKKRCKTKPVSRRYGNCAEIVAN